MRTSTSLTGRTRSFETRVIVVPTRPLEASDHPHQLKGRICGYAFGTGDLLVFLCLARDFRKCAESEVFGFPGLGKAAG